jgi:Uncharacterized protein family, UPF0114
VKKIFRIAIIVVVIATFMNALVFVGLGIYRMVNAYILFAQTGLEDRPGIHLVESMDLFLISLVFLIIAFGFKKLFVPDFSGLGKLPGSILMLGCGFKTPETLKHGSRLEVKKTIILCLCFGILQ